jgi:aminoglycoside phosphotransferase (APT) family kinase protein
MTAPVAAGTRIPWEAVPEHVRGDVEASLGSPVVSARTQVGGFSPGAAVRVVCADGSRAFVKACGSDLNPDTPDLNRAEIRALELLPPSVPHARLLSAYDDGNWVVLVLEDVDGRRPAVPWTEPDVALMARSLAQVAAVRAPLDLPPFADNVGLLTAWDEIAADPTGLPGSLLARLPEFLDRQGTAREATTGDQLVHWDARNDNVLLRDGEAVLLDWAWACRGAPWLDTLLLALDFRIQGGPDADAFLAASPLTGQVPGEHLASVVAAAAGVGHERARRPAPPGLPTIRAWQAHWAAVALDWLDDGSLWA